MRAAGLEPLGPYPGGNTPWPSRCSTCKGAVQPRYSQVKAGRSRGNCECAKARHANYTRPEEAERVMLAANLRTLDPFPGTNVKWRSLCLVCDREVLPRYMTVRAGGRACSECAKDEIAAAAVVVMQAANLEPLVPYPGSNKKWSCRCGECEQVCSPTYKHVAAGLGRGCTPTCAAKIRAREAVAAEADTAVAAMREQGVEPLVEFPGVRKPWLARCLRCEREDTPTYPSITKSKAKGCAVCRGQRVDLRATEEVMRAAGLEPLVPYPGSGKPWKCRCVTCNAVVSPAYTRVKNGSGCGYCSGVTLDPATATQFMRDKGLEPLVAYPGSGKPWKCRCVTCNAVVSPAYTRVKNGRQYPCKHCAEAGRDRTGLRTDAAEAMALMAAVGLEPLVPYPGVRDPWESRCLQCDRIVSPALYNVREGLTRGCGYCAGTRIDPVEATALMLSRGFDALAPYPGTQQPWLCRCLGCGAELPVRYVNIKNGSRCLVCSGRLILPEVADSAMRDLGFIPQEPYPGKNSRRWRCLCTLCGQETSPTYKGALHGLRSGCCAGKYDLRVPGRSIGLYLMTHPRLGAAKFGIGIVWANGRMPRVRSHELNGWTLIRAWSGIPALRIGFEVERAILHMWRDAGLPPFLTRADMPQNGNTETVEVGRIDLVEVQDRVDAELVAHGVGSGLTSA